MPVPAPYGVGWCWWHRTAELAHGCVWGMPPASPRGVPAPLLSCAHVWGWASPRDTVGWRGPCSTASSGGGPGVTGNTGAAQAEQPEAPPAAAACRDPGLLGRGPSPACRGADPVLVAAGGTGGNSTRSGSGQLQLHSLGQPQTTISSGGAAVPPPQHPRPDPQRTEPQREAKSGNLLSLQPPPPSTPSGG